MRGHKAPEMVGEPIIVRHDQRAILKSLDLLGEFGRRRVALTPVLSHGAITDINKFAGRLGLNL